MFMQTNLNNVIVNDMMNTGLEIGTNYLEDSMLAAGKKWIMQNPGVVSGGKRL
jgi:hypothetical protein